jgi:glucose/arabinose dehydrogenase
LVELWRGSDFGWLECYYDDVQKKLVLAPEGGRHLRAEAGADCGISGSLEPNDMLIYEGSQFPTAHKDGAFIAFHGSWNRAPLPQGGYNVMFQPLADGKASRPFVVFADGFAGAIKQPPTVRTGLAVGPDGALYIADDQGWPDLARDLPAGRLAGPGRAGRSNFPWAGR